MLEKITLTGFKSINKLIGFELKPINVLIGANGAGKSNFIDFFRMLRAMMCFDIAELKSPSLAAFIKNKGEMDNLVFNGPKVTQCISTELMFNDNKNGYRFDLGLTSTADFLINNEACFYRESNRHEWWELGSGHTTPLLLSQEQYKYGGKTRYKYILDALESWQIYHFHDTSQFAAVRMPSKAYDDKSFRFDAANLPAFLRALKESSLISVKDAYELIVETVKTIAPYFEDFILETYNAGMEEKIKLQWKQKNSSLPMQSYHLSDGTLRFICLATALLQPNPPGLILIDEPELGLHPEALAVLAELVEIASAKTQFIFATQSPAFLDLFKPQDIITVKQIHGESYFERLNENSLKGWINDFSIGQLWRKNVIKGGVVND